ncbi:MAG: glycosyltransferase involved in cell wall biosynthesis [Halieaceae bacterium]|jgi:glycosyltransferase involved in cell wall biosynthesis
MDGAVVVPVNKPSVSVVIAVKNGAAYLSQALDSIQAQSYPALEILVVDGDSDDNSVDIAENYAGVRVIIQSSKGFAAAWNEGIDQSRGDYVAILDSDDIWSIDKLALQVAHLELHRADQYVIAHARFFLEPGAAPPPGFDRVDLSQSHVGFFPSVLMARRSVFAEVGNFGTSLSIASDVEWFRRVADRNIPMAILRSVLLHRRLHGSNLSTFPPDPSAFKRELLHILHHSLQSRKS